MAATTPPGESPREHAPDREQRLPDDAETTHTTVATPETDGARVAEAGHGYVGRMMDDDRKNESRLRDGDAAVDDGSSEGDGPSGD